MGSEYPVGILISYREMNSEAIDTAEGRIGSLTNRTRDSSQGFRNMADGAKQLGQQFSTMGASAISMMAAFDQSMANVASIVVGTQEEVDALRQKAETMGETMPISAQEAADGFYQLASAGKSANDIMEISEGITKASIAANADFATTANIVTAAQDIWKVSNEDLNVVNDILLNTVKGYKTTLPELGISLANVAKQAETMGLSMSQTASLIGMMRQEGLDASTAGTGLRNVFIKLSASANATEGALAVVGKALAISADGSLDLQTTMQNLAPIMDGMANDVDRVAFLNEAFGARAATAAKILIDQADSIDQASAALEELGSVEAAYNIQMEGTENQLKTLQSEYDAQSVILGEQLLPMEIKLLELKIGLLKAFNKLPGPLGEYAGGLVFAAGQMSSYLIPLSLIIQGMRALNLSTIKTTASMVLQKVAAVALTVAKWAWQAAQWALNIAMDANPVGIIIIAIAALVAIIIIVVTQYDKMSTAVKVLSLLLLYALGPIGMLVAAILIIYHHWDLIIEIVYLVGDAFKWLGNLIATGFVKYIELHIAAWKKVFEIGKIAYEAGKEFIGNIAESLIEFLPDAWEKIRSKIEEIFNFVQMAKDAGKDFIEGFADGIVDSISGVKDRVEDAAGKIAGFFGGSPPHYGPLKDAMDKGGPSFVQGYLENMTASIPVGGSISNISSTDNSMNIGEFTPTFNRGAGDVGQGDELEENLIVAEFERALKLMRREAMRG